MTARRGRTPRPLLVAIALGTFARSKAVNRSSKPGMGASRAARILAKISSVSRSRLVDRRFEFVPVDHQLQRDASRSTHHLVEQFFGELQLAAAENLCADVLVQLLRVEHQAVEIEDDGPGSLVGKRIERRHFSHTNPKCVYLRCAFFWFPRRFD